MGTRNCKLKFFVPLSAEHYSVGINRKCKRCIRYCHVNLVSLTFHALLAEAITVDIEFRNPLQISLSISNISLICEHSASFDEVQNGKFSYFYSFLTILCLIFLCLSLCNSSSAARQDQNFKHHAF